LCALYILQVDQGYVELKSRDNLDISHPYKCDCLLEYWEMGGVGHFMNVGHAANLNVSFTIRRNKYLMLDNDQRKLSF